MLTYLIAAWAASRISGKSACGLDSMLIIPKVTGVPLAGLGVPSAELLAAVPGAELVAGGAAGARSHRGRAPELEPELEELPQAVNPTAATAHAPTAPRFLSYAFISPSLCRFRADARDVCIRNGATDCAPSRETYTVVRVYASDSY